MAKNANFCEVTTEVKDRLKKFRYRKEKNVAAIVLKIDKESRMINIEEEFEDCTMDELQDELPSSQPRFIVVSSVVNYDDGRVKYPQCVIYWSPQACPPDLHLLYSSSCKAFVSTIEVKRQLEIRDATDLTQEWLTEELS